MSKKNDSSPSSMDQDMNQDMNLEFVEFQNIIGEPYKEQISSLQDELIPVKQLLEENSLLLDRLEPLVPELLERSLIHNKEQMLNILSPISLSIN